MKLLYLVLDGAADKPNGPTPYEKASTPGLDRLVSTAQCGMQYSIGEGIAPESDTAVISILGYNPNRYHLARGPLEALGVSVQIREGVEVAFRANFATVEDGTRRIIDRRCGRDLSSEEAKILAEALNGLSFGEERGYAKVKASIGHRAVVVFGSDLGLSDNVSYTDPAYGRVGRLTEALKDFKMEVLICHPLDDTPEASRTARLVNIFTEKAMQILSNHPVNRRRAREGRLKANTLILRDSGARLSEIPPISRLFGLRFGAVTEMPVERGIVRLLKMEEEKAPPPTEDKIANLRIRLHATKSLLDRVDVVYVHLKGPDEPGHDGDFEGKVEAIETIDEYFISPLLDSVNLRDLAFLVTSDHATPWRLKAHSSDPIPFMISSENIPSDGLKKFSERDCAEGSLGTVKHGWQLLPLALQILNLKRGASWKTLEY